jgi:hypothetical protein
MVEGTVDRVRSAADGVLEGFRGASRWQRMRVSFVGGWILASLLALWIACPSSGPRNAIGADVHVLKESMLGAQQILVRNESDEVWTDVVLVLDGTWRFAQRALRPKEQMVVSPPQFQRGAEPAPQDLRPRSLDVECRQGKARFEFR